MYMKNGIHYFLSVVFFMLALTFFVYLAITAFPGRGIFDFPIFVDTAIGFDSTGIVYDRSSAYAPNLAVYKFPPLIVAVLIEGYRHGLTYQNFFNVAYFLHIFFYAASVFLLGFWSFSKKKNISLSVSLCSIGLMFFPLLDTNILRLQIDIYVFFLVVSAFLFFDKKMYFFSGVAISIASCMKIYPIILMAFILPYGIVRSLSGFLFGFLVAVLFGAHVVGWKETLFFFNDVLPILLRELPAGGGDGNISLPTLLFNSLAGAYLFPYTGVFSLQEGIAKLVSSDAKLIYDEIKVQEISDGLENIKKLIKLVCAGFFGFMVFFSVRRLGSHGVSSERKHLDSAAMFAAFVIFMILFMQNSWLNYQVVLVLPVMIILFCLASSQEKNKFLLMLTVFCLISLWCASFLDAAQERVNHFPVGSVSQGIRWLTERVEGLSEFTRRIRCLSALGLLYISLATGLSDKTSSRC